MWGKIEGWRGVKIHMKKIHRSKHRNKKVLKVTYEEGEQLKCNTCGSEFNRKIDLQNHMKRHSSEIGEGKFKCEYCLLYLTTKNSLKMHIQSKHSLKRHIQSKHSEDVELLEANLFLKNIQRDEKQM